MGDEVYFPSYDKIIGSHLWKSDFSGQNVRMVNEPSTGTGNSGGSAFTEFKDKLYFVTSAGTDRLALWRTDGSSQGTEKFTHDLDININFPRGNPAVLGDWLYFAADDSTSGSELWRTDGTVENTLLFRDIWPGKRGSSPSEMTIAGDVLYFVASTPTTGSELWKSDGTSEGTVILKEFTPGYFGSILSQLTMVGDTLFFRALGSSGHGEELWKSDGTQEGTVLVKDIYPGITGSDPESLCDVDGKLYFIARHQHGGNELWCSDGTAAGTELVLDPRPSGYDGDPRYLTNVNGTLYFEADGSLWKSDGTPEGTLVIFSASHTGRYSNVHRLENVEGLLFFDASYGTGTFGGVYERWSTDGTSEGTKRFFDPAVTSFPYMGSFVPFKRKAYFPAASPETGLEIYSLDLLIRNTLVSKIDMTGATIGTSIYPEGEPISLTLDYGKSPSYGNSITIAVAPDQSQQDIQLALSELDAGTKYHYRFTAISAEGSFPTTDSTFTTLTDAPPFKLNPAGGAEVRAMGNAGDFYRIHRSTDLETWDEIATVTAERNGEILYTDAEAPPSRAFYKISD